MKKCFLQPCYCVILKLPWVVLLDSEFFIFFLLIPRRAALSPHGPQLIPSCSMHHTAMGFEHQSDGSLKPTVPGQVLLTTVSNIISIYICRSCHITLSKFESLFSPSDSESRISYISSWSNSKALRGAILPKDESYEKGRWRAPVCLSELNWRL